MFGLFLWFLMGVRAVLFDVTLRGWDGSVETEHLMKLIVAADRAMLDQWLFDTELLNSINTVDENDLEIDDYEADVILSHDRGSGFTWKIGNIWCSTTKPFDPEDWVALSSQARKKSTIK